MVRTKQSALDDFISTAFECPDSECDREFDTERGMKIHHSHVHVDTNCECEWCGEGLKRTSWRLKHNDKQFCDEECQGKWQSDNWTGEGSPRYNKNAREERDCELCGDTFTTTEWDNNRFCGEGCKHEWLSEEFSGEGGPGYSGVLSSYECDWCEGEYEAYPHEDRRFCGRSCYDEWQSEEEVGPNHPLWKGGSSMSDYLRRFYGDDVWLKTSREIRSEAGGKCEMCGSGSEHLHTHHILPIRCGGTNSRWNLIAVCPKCHKTAEAFADIIFDPIYS